MRTAITHETRQMLDRYSKRTGIKKSHLIEEALRSYLIALEGLPAELVVPSTIRLSANSSKIFVRMLRKTKPNVALKKLMRDRDESPYSRR